MRPNSYLAAILLVLLGVLPGCDSPSAGGGKRIPHLRTITTLYFTASSGLGGPPANEAEFKARIEKLKPDMSVLEISSIDELFVSDRDGQPLVVLYGPAPKGVARGVIAYEQAGVDGVRLVGFNTGQIQEADASQFATLVTAPGLSAP